MKMSQHVTGTVGFFGFLGFLDLSRDKEALPPYSRHPQLQRQCNCETMVIYLGNIVFQFSPIFNHAP